ncbi:hypothetical protein [Streptomyces sp. NPDC005125]
MAANTVAIKPDDLIDYGRFLRDIASVEGAGADTGLGPIIESVRSINVPVPDGTLIPGGAAFAKALMKYVGSLVSALEEIQTGCVGLGEGVENVGHSSRSAEELRAATTKDLGPKIPKVWPSDGSPLGDGTSQKPLPDTPVDSAVTDTAPLPEEADTAPPPAAPSLP